VEEEFEHAGLAGPATCLFADSIRRSTPFASEERNSEHPAAEAANREDGDVMSKLFRTVSLAVGLSIAANAQADWLSAGTRLPELTLPDQHGAESIVGADAEIVIFSRDMDAGNIVKAALAEQGGKLLAEAKAAYIADIAAMPSVITNLFAVPSMRKRDYRIFLDRDGKATADFPSKEGKVTVMKLGGGAISQIDFVDTAAALSAMLKKQ
jgi:hypothetical protein